jgi:hypothetical protein
MTMKTYPTAGWIKQNGYDHCIALSNGRVRVVLEPDYGGRVLEYSLDGVNVLYIDPSEDGLTYKPGKKHPNGWSPCAGRFDIGPETITPEHLPLWMGRYEAHITGPYSARLTSPKDETLGIQLVREFVLDEKTSRLSCTQVIKNIGSKTVRFCHWSRTFVLGGGICFVPVDLNTSRFPKGYILYGPNNTMLYQPEDHPNVRIRDGVLEIMGPQESTKYAMDACEGWLAYLMRQGRLFVKTFPLYPGRVYGEMTGNNASVWYNQTLMCEVEPIGPIETILPGQSADFTECWHLFEFPYPADKTASLEEIRRKVFIEK